MKRTTPTAPDYKGFRFPSEMISHAVWRYFRCSLRFRDVEELLAQRGIVVTDETVRQWCLQFGQSSANELRRRRPRCGDKWYLDEVVLSIGGKNHSLWRAVDQHGKVLDICTGCSSPDSSHQICPKEHNHRNHAEKRLDGPTASIPSPGRVSRSFAKQAKRRKSAKRLPRSELRRLVLFI